MEPQLAAWRVRYYFEKPAVDDYPTSKDVVAFLNERFAARSLPYRLEHIAVLPYVNPMWMANWEVPQLADAPEHEIIEEEIREARWRFPQVLEVW